MVRLLQVDAYKFYCNLHPEKRVSQPDFLYNIVQQHLGQIAQLWEKMYPSPAWCQPFLMDIFLSNIRKVATSIARKIFAWFNALVMFAYRSIVSHYTLDLIYKQL